MLWGSIWGYHAKRGGTLKLNYKIIENAKPQDKAYKLFDGGGLFLLVTKKGSKLWRLKYRYMGKEKLLSIGSYPILSLAEAREERWKAKNLLAQNPSIDPIEHKREYEREIVKMAQNTFRVVALEWFDNQIDRWSKGYAQKNKRILEMNLYPHIGNTPISKITAPDLLDCIRDVEKRGALDIADKTKQIAGMVFRYGIQTGRCERNPASDLHGALKSKPVSHFAAMDIDQLPAFINALERNEARLYERTRRAVWFSLYTFQRPGEIRQAQWSEIDFENAEWHINADKMKMRRAHMVPLSRQVIEILKTQKKETLHLKTDWVFPSQNKPRNPMSDGTVNKAIKRLGFGDIAVAHGFRALARTVIREKLKYDSEIIEKQLAHKTRNPLGEAYDRTQFLDERRVMIQDWADYVDEVGG